MTRKRPWDFIPQPENLLDIGREDASVFSELGFDFFTGMNEVPRRPRRRPEERITDERTARLLSGEAPLDAFEKNSLKQRRDLFGRNLRVDP